MLFIFAPTRFESSFGDDAKRINARNSNVRVFAFYLNENDDLNKQCNANNINCLLEDATFKLSAKTTQRFAPKRLRLYMYVKCALRDQ